MALQMNFDEVLEKGGAIAARAQDVVDLHTWLKSVVNDQLPAMWQGKGYDGFVTRFSEMEPSFDAMRQLIEDIGNGVILNAREYYEFDENAGNRNR